LGVKRGGTNKARFKAICFVFYRHDGKHIRTEKPQCKANFSVISAFSPFFLYCPYRRMAVCVEQPALRDAVTEYRLSAVLLYPAQSFGLYQTSPDRGDFFER
jgi:hypothetical protein